jgi:hypothetical protein
MTMGGTLALVGSGEFLDGMRAIDAELLGRISRAGQRVRFRDVEMVRL